MECYFLIFLMKLEGLHHNTNCRNGVQQDAQLLLDFWSLRPFSHNAVAIKNNVTARNEPHGRLDNCSSY